jgi:Zn-dependent protease
MKNVSGLSQIFKVKVHLHYTWIMAFVLVIAIMVTQFSEAYPLWQRMLLGLAAGFIFLMSISIREFILRFLAISKGIPIRGISLYVFGGAPRLTAEVSMPSLDVLVAVTGLIANLLVVMMFWGVYIWLVVIGSVAFAGLTQWLAYIYFLLTAFHFLPGFPLDGGRILRAILWKILDDSDRATIIASWTGLGIGLVCLLAGITYLVMTGRWFTWLVLVIAGWALMSAAVQSLRQATLYHSLRNIEASDMMSRDYTSISPELDINRLVNDYVIVNGQRYFIVVDDEAKLRGIVTLNDIKSVSKQLWNTTTTASIMKPAGQFEVALINQSVVTLLEYMDGVDIDYMPVIENEKVIGIIGRDSLHRLGKTRVEIGE